MIDTNLTQQDYDFIERVLDNIENVEGFELSPIGASHGIDMALTNAIEVDLKLMVENKVWPFGYTRREVIERLVWIHGTETSTATTARDINVLEANVFSQDTDQPKYKERRQILQDYVWDFTMPTQKQAEIENAAIGEGPSAFASFEQLLNLNKEYLAIPYEKLMDYANRFQTWINRSKNIRDAIWKMAVGVISEKDFSDAVREYRSSEDYQLGLYEEDIV